jgi:hypothetical protein
MNLVFLMCNLTKFLLAALPFPQLSVILPFQIIIVSDTENLKKMCKSNQHKKTDMKLAPNVIR